MCVCVWVTILILSTSGLKMFLYFFAIKQVKNMTNHQENHHRGDHHYFLICSFSCSWACFSFWLLNVNNVPEGMVCCRTWTLLTCSICEIKYKFLSDAPIPHLLARIPQYPSKHVKFPDPVAEIQYSGQVPQYSECVPQCLGTPEPHRL